MLKYSTSLNRVFQALADPTRRAIVEQLARGPASVGELAGPLDMSLPAVVHHLARLESSGLVRSEKTGRVRTCRVDPAALHAVEQWLAQRRLGWQRRLDRLGDYLAQESEQAPHQRRTTRKPARRKP